MYESSSMVMSLFLWFEVVFLTGTDVFSVINILCIFICFMYICLPVYAYLLSKSVYIAEFA